MKTNTALTPGAHGRAFHSLRLHQTGHGLPSGLQKERQNQEPTPYTQVIQEDQESGENTSKDSTEPGAHQCAR